MHELGFDPQCSVVIGRSGVRPVPSSGRGAPVEPGMERPLTSSSERPPVSHVDPRGRRVLPVGDGEVHPDTLVVDVALEHVEPE